MKFEEKLQKLRKASGMNQEQLADKLNVSRQAVSKWESGASYPEMDKLIQMSKIFNCTLDELVNESDTDKTIIESSAKKRNLGLDSLMEFINKSINMFSKMKFGNLVKSILELGIVALIIIGISAVVYTFGSALINEIVFIGSSNNEIMWNILYFISNLFDAALLFIIVALDLLIYLQIYKIRYLDYYDKLMYEYEQKEKNEVEEVKDEPKEEVKEIIKEVKKDRIVIRDPEHRPFAFLSVLSKWIVNIFKFIVGCVGICFIFSLIFFVVGLVVSIYLSTVNDLFGGVIIAFLALIVFNILLIEVIYRFINSMKVNRLRVFIQGISCIIVGSIGIGLCFIELKDIDFIEYPDSKYFIEEKSYIDFNKDINTIGIDYSFNTSLVIDDSIEHGLEYKIYYNKDLIEYEIINDNNRIELRYDNKLTGVKDCINYSLDKLRNDEIITFDLYNYPEVEIRGSKEDIEYIVKYLRDKEDIIYADENQDGYYHAW